ncbi:MAG: UDP-N-acetylmuramoyl-L-alanine--D-glutamate ligase [Ruminococcaceae bacterium]|nr:UDP-N-acetylmuramoyl-L-alanine--D-glutamate ligase [Oscillospiraceae bacterium]
MLKEYASDYNRKYVGFVGMGVSNLPVIRLFLSVGAKCIVRDKNDLSERDFYKELSEQGVEFISGEGYLDDIYESLLFLSPAVRPDLCGLNKARANGTRITSEMEEFFSLCPCKKIAVTGSDGKTTTTTLIAKLLEAEGYKVWLGGNIGVNLFATLDEIGPDDYAVIELSSFQLMKLSESPDIAVVTNVAPNHLDWHTDMNEYVEAKKRIFAFQKSGSKLVLNLDDEYAEGFAKESKGSVAFISGNSTKGDICFNDNGIYTSKGELLVADEEIRIVGRHNRYNYAAAYSAVRDIVSVDTLKKVAREFGGVEHRIEFVREINGIKFYNSSIDSSPSRTTACINAFKTPIIAICGGYDKNIPYEPLGALFLEKVKYTVLCGATAPKIAKVFDSVGYTAYTITNDFNEAVDIAYKNATAGDNVVLTPASASFDMFGNFAERGNTFKQIVNSL